MDRREVKVSGPTARKIGSSIVVRDGEEIFQIAFGPLGWTTSEGSDFRVHVETKEALVRLAQFKGVIAVGHVIDDMLRELIEEQRAKLDGGNN